MKEVFALRTIQKNIRSEDQKEEGFLLFISEITKNNFLSFLKENNTEVLKNGDFSHYEDVGRKNIPENIFNFVQNRKTFFVLSNTLNE